MRGPFFIKSLVPKIGQMKIIQEFVLSFSKKVLTNLMSIEITVYIRLSKEVSDMVRY